MKCSIKVKSFFPGIFLIMLSLQLVVKTTFAQEYSTNINWNKFLSTHDLIFDKMPRSWEEAPYFGNGFIGSMIYGDSANSKQINIQVFRTDVQDHRNDSSGWTAYSRPRLPIGYFTIILKGKIKSCYLRMHLFTADLTGSIQTTEGSISLHHFVSAQKDLIFTKIVIHGNEKYSIIWHPAEAKSTRKRLFPNSEKVIPLFAKAYGEKYNQILKVYVPNPSSVLKQIKNISLSIQNLLYGGQYVVAWKEEKLSSRPPRSVSPPTSSSIFIITIKNSYPDKKAQAEAKNLISSPSSNSFDTNYKEHISWWNHFYRKSFLSIPDKELEGFYWLQMYKLGCASRAQGPIMDTSGPWFQDTPWPYITWDLNVELCYWALNTSNHLDIAMSLPNSLKKYQQNLIINVKPVEWRKDAAYLALSTEQDLIGSADDDKRYQNLHADLPWIMHNVWLMYKFSMDKNFLRDKCYPLLKRSMAYYMHILRKENDGKYHIPIGYSPEYPGKGIGQEGECKDPNIDIALLRWGLPALIESSKILNTDGSERKRWKNVADSLVDFQKDADGFMIGADMPYNISHRHYSHLLMIYPLYLVNIDNGNKELIERSLRHWIGDPKGLQGYSYTGASSISAAIGEGDEALKYLKGLHRFLQPNGLYKESGPVFETPLSGAESIQDMLLQSWGGKIRIFPAVPGEWKDITFRQWLAEGAFEVSAKLTKGKPEYIMIKSLAGAPCLFSTSMKNPVVIKDGKKIKLIVVSKDSYKIDLKKGETVTVK